MPGARSPRPMELGIDVADAPDAGAVIDHLLRSLAGVPEGDQLATPTTLPVLGEVTVDFDGTTCSYDGPPTLPAGAYEVSTAAGPTEYIAAVAHLVAGATVDEVLAWVAEHPDEDPPMVDDIAVVGGWGEPSPAAIVFRTGTRGDRVRHRGRRDPSSPAPSR